MKRCSKERKDLDLMAKFDVVPKEGNCRLVRAMAGICPILCGHNTPLPVSSVTSRQRELLSVVVNYSGEMIKVIVCFKQAYSII